MKRLELSKPIIFIVLILLCLSNPGIALAIPVFPGAIGYGSETRAAYGAINPPIICVVTNLSHSDATLVDSTRGGVAVKTGSLRACITYAPPSNTGKLIIFEVSGTIHAESEPYKYIIKHPYTTIAGQTAPSPGITLRNLTITSLSHDVLIQHLRIRVGDAEMGVDPDKRRVMEIIAYRYGDVYNNIIDHCSFSWGIDINCGMGQEDPYKTTDVTWSNNIISEGLHMSLHPKGVHSKGMSTCRNCTRISLIYNLFAHSVDRNPQLQSGSKVVANNMMYNCKDFSNNIQPAWGPADLSIVGNRIKGGPSSTDGCRFEIGALRKFDEGSKIYFNNNMCDAGKQKDALDWSMVQNRFGFPIETIRVDNPPLWPTGFVAMEVEEVEEYILVNVGARPNDRDAVDNRILSDVIHRSGRLLNSPTEVGGWPLLEKNTIQHQFPMNPHSDEDGDGYMNLEEWLHNLANNVEKTISSPKDLKITK